MSIEKLLLELKRKKFKIGVEFVNKDYAYNITPGKINIDLTEKKEEEIKRIGKSITEGKLMLELNIPPLIKINIDTEVGKYHVWLDVNEKVFYRIDNQVIPLVIETIIKGCGYEEKRITRREFDNKIY